jgi:O-antigen/teichoic acid export membrane protein
MNVGRVRPIRSAANPPVTAVDLECQHEDWHWAESRRTSKSNPLNRSILCRIGVDDDSEPRHDQPKPDDLVVGAGDSLQRDGRRVLVATSSFTITTLLIAVLGTATLRLLTYHFGPTSYGAYVTALTFVTTVMAVADLGVNSYAGREIARDPSRAEEILSYNLGLRLTLSVLLIPIVLVLGSWIYRTSTAEIVTGIVVLAFAIPFDAIRTVSLSLFVSRIAYQRTALVNLSNQLLFIVGVVVALILKQGIVACFWAYLCATVVTSLASYWMAHQKIRFRPRWNVGKWITTYRASLSIGLIQIVYFVYIRTNVLLLSVLSGVHAVAIYGLSSNIVAFFLVVPNALLISLMPVVTRASSDRVASIVSRATAYLAAIASLVAAGAICLGSSVIHLIGGSKFAASSPSLSILSVSLIAAFVSAVFSYVGFARNVHHRILYANLCGLAIDVVLCLILIPRFGPNGAAASTLATEVATLVLIYWVYRNAMREPIGVVLLMARPMLAGLTSVLVFRVFLYRPDYGLIGLVGVGIAITLLFTGVLFLLRGVPEGSTSMFFDALRRRSG